MHGCHGLCKAHIVHAHEIIRVILAKLYRAFISHYYIPPSLTQVIFKPLVKDKLQSFDDVNNYRPIAIVPILSKIFESCLLIGSFAPFLNSHSNQFGFVEHGGCDKALFAVKSVVNYFLKHKSPVFICSLDAEKAFDRVNHYGLLIKLIDCGLTKVSHLIIVYMVFLNVILCTVGC